MSVHVHIERLVLEGVASTDRHRIGAAVERELAHLIAQDGLPDRRQEATSTERVRGKDLNIGQQQNATEFGVSIAQSIFGGLKQ